MTRKRERLDRLVVERGLVDSRARAQARIMAGDCFVDGARVDKPGTNVPVDAELELRGDPLPFVSRGGLKLVQALDHFGVDPRGRVAMDVGASTGGFTDCLLQRGAERVYAIDVGYGQLAWSLRCDPRVVVLERTNIRTMDRSAIPEAISLAVADCSFVSLTKVFPSMRPFLRHGAEVVALVKPQFEAGRERVGSGGVVRDPDVRASVIAETTAALAQLGLEVAGGVDCATPGPKGNVEYLLYGTVSADTGEVAG
ncbi:MAG: TlyA family RNA methyltransferase [Myxococcales bacterium]|nr:TlyA family RNA methyltransferase [Myxococcales bacterium]MCB9530937.1 TlyA family RNA methyltransferase [Myxococcales bacterium]